MWKRAGVVVATSFVAMLMVGPMANAAPMGAIGGDDANDGISNKGDRDVLSDINVCPDIGGALGLGALLGLGGASNTDAPISCANNDNG